MVTVTLCKSLPEHADAAEVTVTVHVHIHTTVTSPVPPIPRW
jgi:hypothetical protein